MQDVHLKFNQRAQIVGVVPKVQNMFIFANTTSPDESVNAQQCLPQILKSIGTAAGVDRKTNSVPFQVFKFSMCPVVVSAAAITPSSVGWSDNVIIILSKLIEQKNKSWSIVKHIEEELGARFGAKENTRTPQT